METYLNLFEAAIKKQAELIGQEKAMAQAKRAGLGTSRDGNVVSCIGNPQVVLLRLVKCFTASGSIAALDQCTPLIDEILRIQDDYVAATGELELAEQD